MAGAFATVTDAPRKASRGFGAPAYVENIFENCEEIVRGLGAKLNAQTSHCR
jgi:hypothetical protein